MEYDVKYMWRCLQLAKCGEVGAPPNPMVGAVIVLDGRIIGEGYHRRCGGPHAEVNAVNSVPNRSLLSQSTLYVSLEPCAHYGKTPPCAQLIVDCGIPRVVVGCQDPFAKVNGMGLQIMRNAGVEVVVGVLEEECLQLNRRFVTFHQKRRPWITLKWAQSSDGFMDAIRTKDDPPACFSTPFTQALVHRLRATHQAILVGTNTALMDNPTLTTRAWPGENALRLTIDRKGCLPSALHLKDGSTPTHIYSNGNLHEILADLYQRGVQSLLVEGGSCLLQSFINEDLWDEARVETSPVELGDGVKSPEMGAVRTLSKERIDGNLIEVYAPQM